MAKPWEETWTPTIWLHDSMQDPLWALLSDRNNPRAGDIEIPFCEFEPNEEPRAKLAAAAPEMARALLLIYEGKEVSAGIVREALRSAGVLPSFDEEVAALQSSEDK